MKKRHLLLSLLITAVTGFAHADDAAIRHSLTKLGLQQIDIQHSTLPGMKTVLTESGVLYITEDGKQFIQGPLYDVSAGGQPVNVTNTLLQKKVDALRDEMIVYKAPKEEHVITVFTDITCGYCHKLHSQMADYNALGVTVRYLAFPREGMKGQVAKNMKSIWCVADRKKAFDAAMKGETVSPADCSIDLAKQYQLGVLYGIQGTPAILLQNGMVIPGYQGPQEMKQMLDSQKGS
ncbi:bifunctional protein-disulfide isomerase/oxidoreductase DsbC [Erwinia tracheiphila]|uniref:Thiol:disulfide interchange protein n=1 Tax=Erwinia tracheiphila TaxID=65700 RepID=A0A0M2K948_9GAMM|nr:bifunctional protein-disulfide isomerase/oxidoreductase DsbC [Erwinia tracheiphila]AXF76798.1 bifunctional protein-disulfide isomerase/oxidoreductase DsbC [Erwinia tracheiphila]EOS95958.1 protein disulfide isomerase II DsbC [Erwinia tracheiphila PSU-1]KKF35439.1 disulfide bond formation protein DsbC [Erwinia tracheiphila]UIA84524.1 bifunctional protein-disulfide isomerase/oxidoreductase DsbC [Erwinia tracheiphila]UIA87100.1 bifunctional protein-disulfide isomerase/oxidoreductase DsbC [Erwin